MKERKLSAELTKRIIDDIIELVGHAHPYLVYKALDGDVQAYSQLVEIATVHFNNLFKGVEEMENVVFDIEEEEEQRGGIKMFSLFGYFGTVIDIKDKYKRGDIIRLGRTIAKVIFRIKNWYWLKKM